MHMLYHEPSAYCGDCRDMDFEGAVEEVEVCQTLSSKSTWETCWENCTGELFYDGRRDEVRAYVLERLKDAPD